MDVPKPLESECLLEEDSEEDALELRDHDAFRADLDLDLSRENLDLLGTTPRLPGDFEGGVHERLLERDEDERESQLSSGRFAVLIPLSCLYKRVR